MNLTIVQEQLIKTLDGSNTHITFDRAIENFPLDKINTRIAEVPYSSYDILEHMRFTQWDVLDFIINPNYPPKSGDDYWPPKNKEATINDWHIALKQFQQDLLALKEIVVDSSTDFTSPIPHATDYTIFREILVVGNHNSYHIGQLMVLKRTLGGYKQG